MNENLETQDDDILQTLDLTARLQQSLRRLLTKRKSVEQNNSFIVYPSTEKDESNLLNKIQALQRQNRQLYADNQQLSKQIIQVKEYLRDCKKQLQASKKYLNFLQAYNDDLKKELLFWVKGKKQKPIEEPIVGQLMTKIIQLRKDNQEKQLKLNSLRKTIQINNENTLLEPGHRRSYNVDLSKLQSKSINRNMSQRANNKKDYEKVNNSKSRRNKQKQRSEVSFEKGRKDFKSVKGKNLRKWHNNYISSNEYAY